MRLAHVNAWVHDQDEALAFYTEKLGLELRADVTLEEMNFRWLTVGPPSQPDIALPLMDVPGPPVLHEATSAQVTEVVAKGAAGGIFFETDDCRGMTADLKGRGVEFIEEPLTARTGSTQRSEPLGQSHPPGSERRGAAHARDDLRLASRGPGPARDANGPKWRLSRNIVSLAGQAVAGWRVVPVASGGDE